MGDGLENRRLPSLARRPLLWCVPLLAVCAAIAFWPVHSVTNLALLVAGKAIAIVLIVAVWTALLWEDRRAVLRQVNDPNLPPGDGHVSGVSDMARAGRYRQASLRAFKLTIVSAVLAPLLFALGIGAAMPMAGSSGLVVLIPLSILLAGIAIIGNLYAFLTGIIAWRMGARTCPWVYLDGVLILVSAGFFRFLLSL